MAVQQTLASHTKDLGGGFMIRRLLPSAARQSVGPFVFMDHFGPIVRQPQDNFDVRPHPHIGLATVTYLFEGAMVHRDSLGSVQRIEPGAINWMTAGRGIVHSERTPDDLRSSAATIHGLQLWVGLPLAHEDTAPSFAHTPATAIPQLKFDGADVRVLIGEAWDAVSPVKTLAPTLYLDIRAAEGAELMLPAADVERAVYPVDQPVIVDGTPVDRYQLAVLQTGKASRVAFPQGGRAAVLGGAPMDARRHIWWNFVASSRERIEAAKVAWREGRFDAVPGETEFIPLPQ